MSEIESRVILTTIIVLIALISLNISNKIFKKLLSRKNEIHLRFFKNFTKFIILVIAFYNIFEQMDSFKKFSNAILTSSSLLVVVLGFAFQTSLEDFIAGILISLFKPFNIGDRVNLVNSGISGTIEDITIRHTVVRTFTNNRLIIPNSVMNKETIENSHFADERSSNFIDVQVTYESDIAKAKEIIADIVVNHPNVIDSRSEEQIEKGDPQVTVFVRNFGENGIDLRVSVWTKNINTNFATCSEIREQILYKFKENGIEIAYPHTQVLGDLTIKKDTK